MTSIDGELLAALDHAKRMVGENFYRRLRDAIMRYGTEQYEAGYEAGSAEGWGPWDHSDDERKH